MVKPLANMLAKAFFVNTEVDGETPHIVDAKIDVEAPRRKVGEGVVDDGGGVVRSSAIRALGEGSRNEPLGANFKITLAPIPHIFLGEG